MNEKDIEFFESVMSRFKALTEQEQETLLKLCIFSYLECEENIKKNKDKKSWRVQRQTYEMFISILTDSIFDSKSLLFNSVEKDYEKIFGKGNEA